LRPIGEIELISTAYSKKTTAEELTLRLPIPNTCLTQQPTHETYGDRLSANQKSNQSCLQAKAHLTVIVDFGYPIFKITI
jgi:hypothetical protein